MSTNSADEEDVTVTGPIETPEWVYEEAARAMAFSEGGEFVNTDSDNFEWRACSNCPGGGHSPCACAGMPWPDRIVRLAIDMAYRAGLVDGRS